MKVKSFVLLLAVICSVRAKVLPLNNIKVVNLKVAPCDTDTEKVAKLLNISASVPNGTLVLQGKFETFRDVNGPLRLEYASQFNSCIWVPIPCSLLGGCGVPDLCKLKEKQKCNCGSCPVKKGSHNIPELQYVNVTPGLEVLSGSYRTKVNLYEGSEPKPIVCYNAEFDLEHLS